MAMTSFTKCVCDKCKREQIFDTWSAAKSSAWRQIDIEPIGGASAMIGARADQNEPQSLRAIVCGDCAGGLGINAVPPAPLMEI